MSSAEKFIYLFTAILCASAGILFAIIREWPASFVFVAFSGVLLAGLMYKEDR